MSILSSIIMVAMAFAVVCVSLLFPVLLFFALDGVVLDGHFANKIKRKLKIDA